MTTQSTLNISDGALKGYELVRFGELNRGKMLRWDGKV